ncbi:STAS domain-containing protein [Pseudonocardia ammonioxydans]|uniref:STAS domain-containing protein n=1 Tax=Pseudonocardia ammonioxydans TaxID=260086 RepID=UPI0015A6E663|nr:STAS domain-containing protein [Pseudonocardia ammonioxydans]
MGERTTCFIGSILDTPGEGLIVLRGELDAAAVDRLREHIDAFLAGTTRHLVLDARAVQRFHPALPGLLGGTQRRLAVRRGMLQVRGLAPAAIAPDDTASDGPASDYAVPDYAAADGPASDYAVPDAAAAEGAGPGSIAPASVPTPAALLDVTAEAPRAGERGAAVTGSPRPGRSPPATGRDGHTPPGTGSRGAGGT